MSDSVAPWTVWLTVPPTNWADPAGPFFATPVAVNAVPPAAARTALAAAVMILLDLCMAHFPQFRQPGRPPVGAAWLCVPALRRMAFLLSCTEPAWS